MGVRGGVKAGFGLAVPSCQLNARPYAEGQKTIEDYRAALVSKLDGKKALDKLEDDWWGHRVFWKQIAGFYLGVALAMRLPRGTGCL